MSEGKIVEERIPRFRWEIDANSLNNKPVGRYLLSPIFFTKFISNDLEKFKNIWQLKLFPKGGNEDYAGFVSLYLFNLSNRDITVTFSVSLLNQNNEIVEVQSAENQQFEANKSLGFPTYVKKSFIFDSKNNIINNDKVTVLCEIILTKNSVRKKFNELTRRLEEFDKFEKLMINNEFSDITVKAEGKIYHLHKCILTSCSDVFETMFKIDMKEKDQNLVEIDDIRSEVLDEFFRFIYTGKVNKLMDTVGELLTAAEKYNVKSLKEFCEEKMCERLNNDNALQYLRLSLLNNSEKLKKSSINWLSLNLEEFLQKPEFNDLGMQQPELLLEVIKNHLCVEENPL